MACAPLATSAFGLILLVSLALPCLSNHQPQVFLGSHSVHAGPAVSTGELDALLQRQFEEAFGSTSRAGRSNLDAVERSLSQMHAALPKNDKGRLAPSVVRYALHRYFAGRHGWLIRGLEPAGGNWSSSSPAAVAQDRVPSYLQELYEQRLGSRGLNLRELAVLASTLEQVVHEASLGWLGAAYRVLQIPTTGRVSAEQVGEVLSLYMMMFVTGEDLLATNQSEVLAVRNEIHDIYPAWDDTQVWLRDVEQDVAHGRRARGNPFVGGALPFEEVGHIVDDVHDRYGKWQNAECMDMKDRLLALEDTRGSGRVSLSRFYSGRDSAEWQFSESVDYLRQLGALDESDPPRLRVIVPNYIGGANTCLASAGLYDVCCISECEGLLGELEQQSAAPVAPASQVAVAVSQISSSSVDAPRNLTTSLLSRLDEVASRNGGSVPLHGRLFAQWMHHAFPNECPYPHVSGSTAPKKPDDWMAERQADPMVTADERSQHTEGVPMNHPASESGEPLLQWDAEEELLVSPSGRESGDVSWGKQVARAVLLVGILASAAKTFRIAMSPAGPLKTIPGSHVLGPEKFSV
jgi:hypothetical protein